MMSVAIKGKPIDEVRDLARQFKAMMSIHESALGGDGDGDGDDEPVEVDEQALGDLAALQGVVKFPPRIKCATLAWITLAQGLDEVEAGRRRRSVRRHGVLERFRVDGKVAIVTGAGRGIGAGCALALAEAGADVVLAARTEEQLQAVAKEVEALGRRAVVVPADVNDDDALAALVAAAVERARRRRHRRQQRRRHRCPGRCSTPRAGYLERAFHFNVTTAFVLTKAAVPAMLERGGGAVVNISSAMGRMADRGMLAYGTAKAALAHMTRLAAADLAPRIRVNAIAVGSVATSALEVVTRRRRHAHADGGRRRRCKRLGEVEDIAAACLWLASPAGGVRHRQGRRGRRRPPGPQPPPRAARPLTQRLTRRRTTPSRVRAGVDRGGEGAVLVGDRRAGGVGRELDRHLVPRRSTSSGWWSAFSASSATRLMNPHASVKSANVELPDAACRRRSSQPSRRRSCTGVPSGASSATRAMSALRMRTQPFERRRPITLSSFQPWMAIWPMPPAKRSSTSLKPDTRQLAPAVDGVAAERVDDVDEEVADRRRRVAAGPMATSVSNSTSSLSPSKTRERVRA